MSTPNTGPSMIKKELESHLGAENVGVEEFTFAPGASLNPYPGLFLLLAVLLNISTGLFPGVSPWVTAIPALAFAILSPALFVLEFIFGFELVDRFFKKTRSINAIGTLRRPETKNVKRLLILSGHHGSAPQNTWFGLFGDVEPAVQPQRRHGPGAGKYQATFPWLRLLCLLRHLLHRIRHHAGYEPDPAGGPDHGQC